MAKPDRPTSVLSEGSRGESYAIWTYGKDGFVSTSSPLKSETPLPKPAPRRPSKALGSEPAVSEPYRELPTGIHDAHHKV